MEIRAVKGQIWKPERLKVKYGNKSSFKINNGTENIKIVKEMYFYIKWLVLPFNQYMSHVC